LTQITALTGNNHAYLNNPVFNKRPPVLWSVGWGEYEPYDPDRHGEPRASSDDEQAVGEEYLEEPRPPVWQLLAQSARELVPPFSAQEIVDWFADEYPDIPSNTVRAQMTNWAGNSPTFLSNPAFNRRTPVLWRVSFGMYEPYDRQRHGEVAGVRIEAAEGPGGNTDETARQAMLERYLEEFLHAKLDGVDFGRRLAMWSPDERSSRQFDASPAGTIDFLCRDLDTGSLVVVQLKRGIPTDAVVGQTLRCMGWVKAELASAGQSVEGIIVVGDADDRLLLAASPIPALRVVQYRVDFQFEPIDGTATGFATGSGPPG
jgi:hypothetical protein